MTTEERAEAPLLMTSRLLSVAACRAGVVRGLWLLLVMRLSAAKDTSNQLASKSTASATSMTAAPMRTLAAE